MDVSKRNSALDITRIVAMLSVISIHFFLNIGYYNEPMLGTGMLILTVVRTAFSVCVPLFIILTGYLMSKKKFSGRYYGGIVKTLGIYVLSSLLCIIYKVRECDAVYSVKDALFGILDFSAANYSWYIEMYIGLFLLVPFLNAAYNGLDSRKAKTALVFTMIALTSLPSVVNIYNFTVEGWFKTPYLSTSYQALMPDWWVDIYPLTYYFLGAYIKEYPIKIKKRVIIPLIVVLIAAFGAFNYYRSWGGFYSWGRYQDWGGLPTVVLSFFVFVFLSSLSLTGLPVWSKKLLAHISDLCLGAYLVSYVFDNYFYTILNLKVSSVAEKAMCFVPMVFTVAVASLLMSLVLNIIYSGISKGVQSIVRALKRN